MAKKKCGVCRIGIIIKKEGVGNGKSKENCRTTTQFTSEEGVYYEDGKVWFCNECYDEILKGLNIDYKSFL